MRYLTSILIILTILLFLIAYFGTQNVYEPYENTQPRVLKKELQAPAIWPDGLQDFDPKG